MRSDGHGKGATLVEVLIASALVLLALTVAYRAFGFFFNPSGKTDVATMIDGTFTRQDLRIGLQKLMLRLRESTKIVLPAPGATASSIEVRDVLNRRIRIRLDEATQSVVSEAWTGSAFVREDALTALPMASGGSLIIARPIRISNCSNLAFTVTSPSCVIVTLTLSYGKAESALLTAIHLRNFQMALRGEKT